MFESAEKPKRKGQTTYEQVGVLSNEGVGLAGLVAHVSQANAFRSGVGRSILPSGYFAAVLDLGHGRGLAISTDGVGTKILVAQELGKYDTIGIDCVAMNVNDVICVGAEPISMVDYIAVDRGDPDFLEQIGRGLLRGAEESSINIPAGEIAQLGSMIAHAGDGVGFDLVGTCVGTVELDSIIIGQDLQPGDLVFGIRSHGVHSNGLTLARAALIAEGGLSLGTYVEEFGRTVGEELLEPTRIYVKEAAAIRNSDIKPKALVHITSDGFLNLTRVERPVGYVLESLPEPHPVFSLIQRLGRVPLEEMYRVFNMGIGLCVVVAGSDADKLKAALAAVGTTCHLLGYVVEDAERHVRLPALGLEGKGQAFQRA
ncbi:MAG: phosphoribosylformylglycinamidine cyclo-ligase [Coriobacteriia bacterium]|nr:phosphoribosylformylglycinamidine cyclo-ligase [Coriobacteriia bacterium]